MAGAREGLENIQYTFLRTHNNYKGEANHLLSLIGTTNARVPEYGQIEPLSSNASSMDANELILG